MLDGELKPIPKSLIWKPIIVEPGKWFNVSEIDVVNKLRMFHKNHKKIKNDAKKLGLWNRSKFSLKAMAKEFNNIIKRIGHVLDGLCISKLSEFFSVSYELFFWFI